MKCENKSLKRKTERIQRQKTAKTEGSSPNLPETSPFQIQNEPFTPRTKVDSELREAGVSPSVIPKPIRNKLLFANVISEEIKIVSISSNNEDQQAIRNIISGSIVKKYRQMKTLREINMTNRRKLAKVEAKSVKVRNTRKLPLIEKRVQAKVIDFFKRDNSRMMPGKKDAKRIGKGGPKLQKRILNDYFSNLYEKIITEYPEDLLSFSSFCRMRPPTYLLVNFTTRNACLCTRHQNVALKLKSLQALKIVETHNPDALIKSNSDTDIDNKMEHIAYGKIAYSAWKLKFNKEMVMRRRK